ncbi:MAG: cupin domain-containing protein [Patescibacteria group bacterium]
MQKFFFKDDGFIPNSRFPVLVNRKVVSFRGMDASEAEAMVKEYGLKTGWKQEWLWKVYKRPHYHSTTHEALVVYSGSATLRLGGHRLGKLAQVSFGDIIVIPAGVAHQAMERTKDFQVFGLYPVGAKPWDLLFCRKKERAIALPNLAQLGEPPDFTL